MSRCALDEQAFRCCCQLLLQQSEQLGDGWSWEQVQGSEEGYLKKTVLRSVVADSSPALKQKGAASDSESRVSTRSILEPQREQSRQPVLAACFHADGTDEDDDAVCTLSGGSSRVLQYEYHVLYSCSYSAPVLYFRAFTLEGRSLTLEEVWGSVHPNFKHRLQNSPLNMITQQEHPLLGQPFFMLHPCRTEEFLRPVLQGPQEQHRGSVKLSSSGTPVKTSQPQSPQPVNYVLSWLSVVGPVVGLDVPLKYCTQLQT